MEYNENNIGFLNLSKKKKFCQLNSQCRLAPQPKENENAPQRLLLPPPLFLYYLHMHVPKVLRVFAFSLFLPFLLSLPI